MPTLRSIACLVAGLALAATAVASPAAAVPQARVVRDAKAGTASLVVAKAPARPLGLRVTELWRYEPSSLRWLRVPFPSVQWTVGQGVATTLPQRVGLYWVRWTEDGVPFEASAFVGRVLCNDVMPRPDPRPDMIRACVPLEKSAMARYIPDPRVHARAASPERK